MTDAQLWRLTWEIVGLAIIVGGGGYLCARYLVYRFEREFGDRRTPGE